MQNNKKESRKFLRDNKRQTANSLFYTKGKKLDVVRKGKYEYYSTNRRPYDQRLKCQRS